MVNWHESSPVCGARQLCAWLLLSLHSLIVRPVMCMLYAFYYYFYSVKGRTGSKNDEELRVARPTHTIKSPPLKAPALRSSDEHTKQKIASQEGSRDEYSTCY
jgi:hypothetical protein